MNIFPKINPDIAENLPSECIRETRTLSKDYIVQFKNNFYKISSQDEKTHLFKGAKIEIRQLMNGNVIAFFKNTLLIMTPLSKVCTPVYNEKQMLEWREKTRYKPPNTHPYKQYYRKIEEVRLVNVI